MGPAHWATTRTHYSLAMSREPLRVHNNNTDTSKRTNNREPPLRRVRWQSRKVTQTKWRTCMEQTLELFECQSVPRGTARRVSRTPDGWWKPSAISGRKVCCPHWPATRCTGPYRSSVVSDLTWCCDQVYIATRHPVCSASVTTKRADWLQHGSRVSAAVQWCLWCQPRQQTISCQVRHHVDRRHNQQRPRVYSVLRT